jgi:hypothetical protein
MVNPIFFFGAGAHTAFCPDNKKLLTSFVESNPQFNNEITVAKKSLDDFGIRIDLETVYTLLKAKSNPEEAINRAGPWIAGLVEKSSLPTAARLDNLLNTLESYLIDQFFIEDQKVVNRIVTFYDKFTNALQAWAKRKGDMDFNLKHMLWEVFTTNYDNVIETYATEKSLPFYTGYRQQSAGSSYSIFDESGYSPGIHKIRLYKLHGSVRLYQLDSGRIVESHSNLKKGDKYLGQEIVENVMIFPVQEKYVSKNPYHQLDSLLRQRLDQTSASVVLGHAFNDEAILNAFIDSMIRNKELKLLLLTHSPDSRVEMKFPEVLRGRVIKARGEVTETGDISDL